MVSADDLIHAIQLRMQLSSAQWRGRAGKFPAGWQQWLDSMPVRDGAVSGASADDVIAIYLQRPLSVPPRRVGELSRWQAFTTLWRQQWNPLESRDERRWHWLAAGISGVWHLVLLAVFAWLMYLDLTRADVPPPKGEEMVVQIEYVGDGTPEEVGGGGAPEPVEPIEQAEPSPSRPTSVTTSTPTETLPEPANEESPPDVVVQRETPQPLVVSAPVPDRSEVFVLPPTTPIDMSAIGMPELTAPVPTVEVVEIPRVPRPTVAALPTPKLAQPVLQAPIPEVAVREVKVREVPTPPSLPAPIIRPPTVAPPRLVATPSEVKLRDIPLEPTPTPTPTPGESAPAKAKPVAATAGPEKAPAPGGWPSPERADDWGAAERERAGAQRGEPPGLYNSDGSVRLADTPGSASPGQAPGTITEEIADLDRAGTWLRRAPTDYEPTLFDKYWRPNETLLEEWVRKSITTIRIPIPGTNKTIVCKTVLLVAGGGCGITDPNLNNQPATARPPPDIPFKPGLQEGNGSVPPAG